MKKYAVYKSETGYYCYEYIDNYESLIGTPFGNRVNKENVSIVLDGKGGYFHFTEDDFAFCEIIESDKEYPLSLEKMFFKNDDNFKLGWMSPTGDTYSCDYTGHAKCAIMLAKKFFPKSRLPETALGMAGWLKIIDSWDGTERKHSQFVYSFSDKITKQQADKLFDMGLYENEEVKKLINDCENYW